MRIETKKVKGREYLQYVDPWGHIFHIGSANTYENWQIAAWLYGCGLGELEFEVHGKFKAEMQKRFPTEESDLSGLTGDGMNGYVGFTEKFTRKLQRIFDDKEIELMDLRKGIREKFPNIKTKKDLRETVRYNWRLRHPKHTESIPNPMEITAS
jgi:hypothetical protein